jgi:hypothetical protein
MTFYIRLAFTSGLALRIKEATYFTKSTNKRNPTTYISAQISAQIYLLLGPTNIYVPTDICADIYVVGFLLLVDFVK